MNIAHNTLRGKKVLLIGLGILGGGVATARWLAEQGAVLTVTDKKSAEALRPALDSLAPVRDRIRFVLGGHDERDVDEAEVIVVNPDVPLQSPILAHARAAGKRIENELTLFARYVPHGDIIAVTGTRGKTTTVNWIAHLLRGRYPNIRAIGNSPDEPLLAYAGDAETPVVIEAPSFLLEHATGAGFAPRVAVITNIYRDHLNRYDDLKHYAMTKMNICRNQGLEDVLVLNADNEWTAEFLAEEPRGRVFFFSSYTPLAAFRAGCREEEGRIVVSDGVRMEEVYNAAGFLSERGRHNVENLLAALAACEAYGVPAAHVTERIASLPGVKFRQELVYRAGGISVYNDSAATSPEATVAAVQRFTYLGARALFIIGGTDRDLSYAGEFARVVGAVPSEQLIFLSGSATELMKRELGRPSYQEYDTLAACAARAFEIAREAAAGGACAIVFSPGAKSFEKFRNEYDRGEQFNELVRMYE